MAGNGDHSRTVHVQIRWNCHIGSKHPMTLVQASCVLNMFLLFLQVAEYPFAKYNVQANTYAYSEEEYTRLLSGKWSLYIMVPSHFSPQKTQNGRGKKRTICLTLSPNSTFGGTLFTTDTNIPTLHGH